MHCRRTRTSPRRRGVAATTHAFIVLAIVGCGSSSTGPSGGNAGGTFTASIDGAAWVSDASGAKATHRRPGLYDLKGSRITGTSSLNLEIELYNIAGPGTYPLGVGDKVYGGIGWVTTSASTNVPDYWLTPFSGAAGTITITALSDTRIAGTFSYSAPPYTVLGKATGTKTVTGGSFDLPIEVTGTVAALPANAGGRMSATVGGKPWTAANVALNRNSGNFSLSGDNSSQLVGIILTGVTTAGTYSVSVTPARLITVSGPSTSPTGLNCCWGGQIVVTGGTANLVDVGTVTITTYSSTRVVGTFSAVLGALSNTPASGQLVLANGSFDVGIP